jgi:hypothetical protein
MGVAKSEAQTVPSETMSGLGSSTGAAEIPLSTGTIIVDPFDLQLAAASDDRPFESQVGAFLSRFRLLYLR